MKGFRLFFIRHEIIAAIWVRAFGGWWGANARRRLGNVSREPSKNP